MYKHTLLLLSSLLVLGCDNATDSEEKSKPDDEIIQPIYEVGDFGYWKTEFSETLKSTEKFHVYNSKNNIFKITYQDSDFSPSLFNTYVKIEEKDGLFESNVTLGDGGLYSTGLQNKIVGDIKIKRVGASHINVSFSGVNHLGQPIDIEEHVMYLKKAASIGREATLPELDKSYTTISEVDIEYRGNGEIYAMNTFSGCWFTANVEPSGFTILSTGPADATDYEPWAFDYVVLPENTNCTTIENQAGMINLYYAYAAFTGSYDEIAIETVFEDYPLYNIGISDMDERPVGY